jgi:hypothetical protein
MKANPLTSYSTPTTSIILLSRHILDFGITRIDCFRYQNPDKPAYATWQLEVVYVLFNRDLNLLVRINEMRKEQIIALEEKRERWMKRRGEPW